MGNLPAKAPESQGSARSRGRGDHLPLRLQHLLALLLLFLLGLTLLPWDQVRGPGGSYELGMIQPTTVIAEFDFPVLKAPDQLAREREQRQKAVPAVVIRSDTASVAAYDRMEKLKQRVRTLRLSPGSIHAGAGAPDAMVLPFSQQTVIELLIQEGYEDLMNQAEGLLQDVMRRGFVSPQLAGQFADFGSVRIRDPLGDAIVPIDQLLTADRVRELAMARAAGRGVSPQALSEIALHCAVPNLVLDPEATGNLRRQAAEAVLPSEGMVLKGEKIIGAHERITPDRLLVLQSYEYWRGQRGLPAALSGAVLPMLGRILILFFGLGLLAAFVRLHRPSVIQDASSLWLAVSVTALVLVVAALFIRVLDLPPTAVPLAAAAILLTLFFGLTLALAVCFLPLLWIGAAAGGGTQFIVVIGAGLVGSALLTRAVRYRGQFLRHLAILPLVHLGMLAALAMADGAAFHSVLRDAAAVTVNPLLALALALVVLPGAEAVFRLSSDISLRESLDLNRPLLRRLMIEAPGTYHHSLLVGTLAETAAIMTGANPVLARAIGYYHDVGKLAKPDYFPENTAPRTRNPLGRVAPSVARLILESHIREGAALAAEHRLSRSVSRGILEHHGRSVMHELADRGQKQGGEGEVYRYPGPIPSSRESALVLLANQAETGVRTLANPSHSRIKGLVHQVVQDSQQDGSLDESGLTFSDLTLIRDALVSTMAAAYRNRPGRGEGGRP